MSDRPLLAVIPVRGGSRRIPRKWAADVNGKPLLQHAIDCARAAEGIDRLAVCTDDPAVAAYARLRGVEVIERPAVFAADDVPLAEVARWLVADDGWFWHGDLALIQPTCPLLKPETLTAAIEEWRRLRFDWMITAAIDPHIFWQFGEPIVPRYQSQDLDACPDTLYRESGAVQIGTGDFWRTGAYCMRGIIPIPADEALDIDTFADLEAARAKLGRRTILFHVVASDEKGSGHLRRCLQLSDALAHHDVRWAPQGLEAWAWAEVERHGWQTPNGLPPGVVQFDNWGPTPDLVIIDSLEAADELVPRYAAPGIPTVVFEPDGATRAARYADLVIDEFDDPRYAILRPEFACLPPYDVRERADGILISFGGRDPAGMNDRVERIVRHGTDSSVLVKGPGRHIRGPELSMAQAMCMADLVITSQGRTVHEAAAVGVPCLSIAVNERESRHAKLDGVVYLGLAHTLSDAAILDTVNRLLLSPALRAEMSRTASKQIDGKGLRRVVRKIEDLLDGL